MLAALGGVLTGMISAGLPEISTTQLVALLASLIRDVVCGRVSWSCV